MFAGKYNMTLRVGMYHNQDEQGYSAHSTHIKKPPYKNSGYTQQSISPDKEKDMKVIFCREVKDMPSKYGENGEAMRPITSRLLAIRDYHDYNYIGEGKIVQLLTSKVLTPKTEDHSNNYRVVELQHKPELKELWLFLDRTQNGITSF